MKLASCRITSCPAFLLIALVLMQSAACGGESEPPTAGGTATPARGREAAPPQVKACSLFTKAEIEAATGRPVRDPAEETRRG